MHRSYTAPHGVRGTGWICHTVRGDDERVSTIELMLTCDAIEKSSAVRFDITHDGPGNGLNRPDPPRPVRRDKTRCTRPPGRMESTGG